ncbi:ABC transporter permease [Paraburkholderia haematera]|uniref:Spermidine/putrescine transport system permease protein PotB n=1 Tax=Paraburkholderia haematera TaxID=2793077 RepID=A0ABM8QVB1_9BURK|nr:ABC transporter permease [Paraburkholderia haematera]CAE6717361.1 Spermidine/putrescine transport system permease protein PotB [Paraburkholderia haematera]
MLQPDLPQSIPLRAEPGPLERRERRLQLASLLPAPLIIALFLVAPLLLVVAYSFMEANGYGGVLHKFSLDAYVQLLFERNLDDSLTFTDAYLMIALRSISVAGMTTLITMLVGFPVAVYIALQPAARRNRLILWITIPFWTNLLVRTYAWILLLRDTGVVNGVLQALGIIHHPITMLYTDGAVLVGLVYTYAPFMVLPIYSSVEKMDIRLIEAAHDLYASKAQALLRVVLPAAAPGIVAGCMLTFIPCLGAMIAPELLGGGKKLMLGNLIYRQFTEARDWPFGSVFAVVLLIAIATAAALITLIRSSLSASRARRPQ